jgi:hypothetical protein
MGCRCGAHLASDDQAAGSQYVPVQCNLCTPQMYACAGVLQFPALVRRHQALFSFGGAVLFGQPTRAPGAERPENEPTTAGQPRKIAEAVTIRAGLWSRADTADKRVLSWLGHRCLRIRTVCLERIPLGKRRFQASGRFAPPGGKPASRLAAPALSRWGRFFDNRGWEFPALTYPKIDSLSARIRRVVALKAADGFDRSLPTRVAHPVGPRRNAGAHRYPHQFGSTMSLHC